MSRDYRRKVFLAGGAGILVFLALILAGWWLTKPGLGPQARGYAGSASCRECHEKFYQLWSGSHHGLAMQPVTPEFLRSQLLPGTGDLRIKESRYRTEIRAGLGWVLESGRGEAQYPMEYALGGKNVYYFLTPLAQGRLQVLPLAFDVRQKEWFDTAASMIRHFGEGRRAAPIDWRDPLLTFNTACYGCHVSQLATNYDLQTGAYHTVWAEPGINCETCHGPAAEHNRVCREAPQGTAPADLKIISAKKFTVAQHNDTCSPCHAKMSPLTAAYLPGERYFDHFDLATLEDPDFYPDARDLGENFTLTLWLTSPCVKSGRLSCLHCHTSSGRYRFKSADQANQACLPCHAERVANAAEHINHPADKPGVPTCVACHMPMTEFARMRRSDHSMRPPTPAVTMAYGSPNACNLCHRDKDAAWADQQVRRWRPRNYQKPVLHRAGLIIAARKQDWARLPEMLQYIAARERNEVFAASLIRLLTSCLDQRKWPVVEQALKDPSPLVRAAAAASLEGHLTPASRDLLLIAAGDPYRLVRIRAARVLAAYPRGLLSPADQQRLDRATAELLVSLTARPDDWASHYNLGNYYLDRGELNRAAGAFETASRLQPEAVLPLVNAAIVQARLGQGGAAEKSLRRALKLDAANAPANFNLGLLLAEQGDRQGAEAALRTALQNDPALTEAAYNLGVLLAQDHLPEGLKWLRQARDLQPQQPRFAYTLAFFHRQHGENGAAVKELQRLLRQHPGYAEACFLLGDIYEKQGKTSQARTVYHRALAHQDLPAQARRQIETKLRELPSVDAAK